ncbi:lysozyme inhibitor LprI family protein [Pantoea cypripedii]|uniref:Lysozyme inhibitor LprI-like N-terminal domain-containing protein n=1 Tax=Pantoea cypripedii TaxID=55209 RepID=A0A1X1EVF7_PANCY|nr:lysozyme inhibitor LprI family protein [Pantoea cypripedii]MBP2198169.1 uncharacterized protein [Pantoea cypripedii]ORM94009.1 hypothetical protein HA50_11860 [Pantoea cypripedii]
MSLQRNILASMLLLGATAPAMAASFDCTRASTAQEKLICQNPQLSALDETLAAAYRNKMSGLSGNDAAQLKQSQRDWLKQLRSHGTEANQLQADYQQRIAALSTSATSPAVAAKAPVADVPAATAVMPVSQQPLTKAHYIYYQGSTTPEPYNPPRRANITYILPPDAVIIVTGTYQCGFDNIPDPANGTAYTLVSLQVGTDSIDMLNQHFSLVQIKHQPKDPKRNVPSFVLKEFRSADNQTITTKQFDEFHLIFTGVIKGINVRKACELDH